MSSKLCAKCNGPCQCNDWISSEAKKKIETKEKKESEWEELFKRKNTYAKKKYMLQMNYLSFVLKTYSDSLDKIKGEVIKLPDDKAVFSVMFYEKNGKIGFDYDTSGNSEGLRQIFKFIRTKCGVDNSSITYCAEENIIRRESGNKYLFSLAFRKSGIVPPCEKCKGILKYYKIYFLQGNGWDITPPW